MRFIIAKPADYMSFGDLFYTKPRTGAMHEQFEQLAEICRKRAEEEFPCKLNNSKYKKNNLTPSFCEGVGCYVDLLSSGFVIILPINTTLFNI